MTHGACGCVYTDRYVHHTAHDLLGSDDVVTYRSPGWPRSPSVAEHLHRHHCGAEPIDIPDAQPCDSLVCVIAAGLGIVDRLRMLGPAR